MLKGQRQQTTFAMKTCFLIIVTLPILYFLASDALPLASTVNAPLIINSLAGLGPGAVVVPVYGYGPPAACCGSRGGVGVGFGVGGRLGIGGGSAGQAQLQGQRQSQVGFGVGVGAGAGVGVGAGVGGGYAGQAQLQAQRQSQVGFGAGARVGVGAGVGAGAGLGGGYAGQAQQQAQAGGNGNGGHRNVQAQTNVGGGVTHQSSAGCPQPGRCNNPGMSYQVQQPPGSTYTTAQNVARQGVNVATGHVIVPIGGYGSMSTHVGTLGASDRAAQLVNQYGGKSFRKKIESEILEGGGRTIIIEPGIKRSRQKVQYAEDHDPSTSVLSDQAHSRQQTEVDTNRQYGLYGKK